MDTNPFILAATTRNTRQAYRTDLRHFEQSGGRLPASQEDIVTYLQAFASKLNARTLSRRLTAIKNWHQQQGFADPTQQPVVRQTLKGITNTFGKPKEKAPPLTPAYLYQIVLLLQL